MAEPERRVRAGALEAVSNALVRLHKEQFGRGPTRSRSFFAGENGLVCVMHNALLPAEQKLIAMGEHDRVREVRAAFQWAARAEFIEAVEQILDRKVLAFSSAIDVEQDIVFENFLFEPQ